MYIYKAAYGTTEENWKIERPFKRDGLVTFTRGKPLKENKNSRVKEREQDKEIMIDKNGNNGLNGGLVTSYLVAVSSIQIFD